MFGVLGFKFDKRCFLKIVKRLVRVLWKVTLFLCIYLLFTPHYFKPIENCYIKLHYVYFSDFNMLFKNVHHLKFFFIVQPYLNLVFNEYFFQNIG